MKHLLTAGRWSDRLTPRELDVLELAVQGLSRQHMAEKLGLRFYTVGSHLKKIHRKLGVHNRAGAVAVALRAGLWKKSFVRVALPDGLETATTFCPCCGSRVQYSKRRPLGGLK